MRDDPYWYAWAAVGLTDHILRAGFNPCPYVFDEPCIWTEIVADDLEVSYVCYDSVFLSLAAEALPDLCELAV